MRDIIKPGIKYDFTTNNTIYFKKCPYCFCKYTYQEEDISSGNYLICPYCCNENYIILRTKYKEKKHGRKRD